MPTVGAASSCAMASRAANGSTSEADWDRITAKFNEEHPNVKVELQIAGWDDFATTVQSRIQANDLPDILNDNAFASSAEAGLLIPIDELLSAETIANIEPGLLANGKGAPPGGCRVASR